MKTYDWSKVVVMVRGEVLTPTWDDPEAWPDEPLNEPPPPPIFTHDATYVWPQPRRSYAAAREGCRRRVVAILPLIYDEALLQVVVQALLWFVESGAQEDEDLYMMLVDWIMQSLGKPKIQVDEDSYPLVMRVSRVNYRSL